MRYGSWIVLMGLVSVGGLAAPLAFAQSAPRKFPPPPAPKQQVPPGGPCFDVVPVAGEVLARSNTVYRVNKYTGDVWASEVAGQIMIILRNTALGDSFLNRSRKTAKNSVRLLLL